MTTRSLKDSLVRKDGLRDKRAFPIQKKIDAVALYLATGNMQLVADHTGVSYMMIRRWVKSEWWKDLTAEVKATKRVKVDSKLTQIIDLALGKVEDRLVNGDVVMNFKTGEVERREVSMKDALKASTDLMQRQEAIEKIEVVDNTQKNTESIKDQLTMLADQFARFNGMAPIQVIEMAPSEEPDEDDEFIDEEEEDDDAVYDEREEGLQEGECSLQLSTGSEEEEGSTEQSEGDSGETGFSPQRGR